MDVVLSHYHADTPTTEMEPFGWTVWRLASFSIPSWSNGVTESGGDSRIRSARRCRRAWDLDDAALISSV